MRTVFFTNSCSILIAVNTEVIAQLSKLPNHLRTGHSEEESRIQLQLVHTSGQVCSQYTVAPLALFVAHTFFVVTFHETYPTVCFLIKSAKGTAFFIPHCSLAVSVIHVTPQVHAVGSQFLFFAGIAKMFQNDVSIALCLLDGSIVILQNSYTVCIVIRGCTFVRSCLRETFGQVEAETIQLVFFEEELQIAFHKLAHQRFFVIEIVEDAIRMRSIDVEVRIVCRSLVFAAIPIQFSKRMTACSMVVDNIEDDRHTGLVTGINKLFITVLCSIRLVHSKIEAWIVTPAVVTVKFLHRHQFDSIDTDLLQIRDFVHCSVQITGCRKVAQVHFVNHQLSRLCYLEIVHLPRISIAANFKGRYNAASTFRISQISVVDRSGNIGIVIRIEYFLGIGIC